MVQGRFFLKLCLVLVGVVAALSTVSRAAAQNGWRLCNETSYIIEAATGRPDGNDVIVEGWTRLRPGECKIAMEAPLRTGTYFLFGRSSRAHRGGERSWPGDFELCVDATGSFSIESPPDCVAMGLEPRKFQPVSVDSRSRWTTKFTETVAYTRERSEAAGIQRLLIDSGITSEGGTIDGYIGRRTRASIRAFLSLNNIPENTSDADLIDVLEQVSIERSRNVGLTLCNRTDHRVWSAIGRRRGDGWESRGWWMLEAGACERVIDEPLIRTAHYVYAEMEVKEGFRSLAAADEGFCVARSKFAITGREECEEQFYVTAEFAETGEPVDSKIVYEFFDRDFSPEIGASVAE